MMALIKVKIAPFKIYFILFKKFCINNLKMNSLIPVNLGVKFAEQQHTLGKLAEAK